MQATRIIPLLVATLLASSPSLGSISRTAGTPVTDFGVAGKVTLNIGGRSDTATSIVAQNDNKIIVAGYSHNGLNYDFAITRLLSNGSVDRSFNPNGIQPGIQVIDFENGDDKATAIALQDDGRIVVAGQAHNGLHLEFAVTRLNIDGTIDSSFGKDGKTTTSFGTYDARGNSLVIQSNGRVILAGTSFNGQRHGFALVRYTRNGKIDKSFAFHGRQHSYLDRGIDVYGYSSALDSQNRILVAGQSRTGATQDFVVARYTQRGFLDPQFAQNASTPGVVLVDFHQGSDAAMSIATQSDDRILVGGRVKHGETFHFGVLQLNSNGALDSRFGVQGKATTQMGPHHAFATALTIQENGKIVATGRAFNGTRWDFALARYLPTGKLDMSFNHKGYVRTRFSDGDTVALGIGLLSENSIISVGRHKTGFTDEFAITRHHQ